MTAASHKTATHDFSDFAILKGSIGACLAAYVIIILVTGVVGIFSNPTGALVEIRIDRLPQAFAMALNPATLVMSLVMLSSCVLVGLFWLAIQRGDHTTYSAAARAGAKAASTLIVIAAFFILALTLLFGPAEFGWALLYIGLVTPFALLVGVVAGLAGRLAAGVPTVAVGMGK